MNDILYLVCCKIDSYEHLKYFYKCIKSIKKFLSNDDKILIVDSDSKFKIHLKLNQKNIIIADIKNKNYEAGAILYAYKNFQFKRLLFMHDSCELLEDIKNLNDKIYIYKYVINWDGCEEKHIKSTVNLLKNTKWSKIPNNFITIIGSIMFLHRNILDIFYKNGIENILPKNKIESCAFERIFGIILSIENFEENIKQSKKLPILKNYLGRN